MRLSALWLVAVLTTCSCSARPGFIPAPASVLSDFQALRQPRPDLPVGALWIMGRGPSGAGAASDNLETVRTLASMTFDGGTQASLTLGVLQFLNLDPSLHDKVIARLNDVSIVRMKDMSKLGGPAGQPRVYEALKAGSITVTTSRDRGLNIELRSAPHDLPVFGRGTSARLSTYTMEARDVFFAVRVARLLPARTVDRPITWSPGDQHVIHFGKLRLSVTGQQASKAGCGQLHVSYSLYGSPNQPLGSGAGEVSEDFILPTPLAIGDALFEKVHIERQSRTLCTKFSIGLRGARLEFLNAGANHR